MKGTRAQENKAVRTKALREQLSSQKHVEHVIDISNKLADLNTPLENTDIQRLKAAADIKARLISKYLPDLKAVEITGEDGKPIEGKWTVEFINASKDSAPSKS